LLLPGFFSFPSTDIENFLTREATAYPVSPSNHFVPHRSFESGSLFPFLSFPPHRPFLYDEALMASHTPNQTVFLFLTSRPFSPMENCYQASANSLHLYGMLFSILFSVPAVLIAHISLFFSLLFFSNAHYSWQGFYLCLFWFPFFSRSRRRKFAFFLALPYCFYHVVLLLFL